MTNWLAQASTCGKNVFVEFNFKAVWRVRSGAPLDGARVLLSARVQGLLSGRTKLPNPRAPPMPSDADLGGGWERVRRDCREEGSLEATAQSKR